MKFYKNLTPKGQAVFLIAVGVGLLALGSLLSTYLKSASEGLDAEQRLSIKAEYLEMDSKALRKHFAKNKDEVAQIAAACQAEKKTFNEVSLKVAEVCRLAETMNHFRTHAERPSTFSSAGGTR